MTNEEIKTALNCCMEWTANGGKTDCTNCPMDKNKPCHVNLHLAAVKRINELEAANKKLQDEVDSLCNENDGLELRAESLDEQLTRKTRRLEAENAALRERLDKAVDKELIAKELAEIFDCPCNFTPLDEEMQKYCGDDCIDDSEVCWQRFIEKTAEKCLAELGGEK